MPTQSRTCGGVLKILPFPWRHRKPSTHPLTLSVITKKFPTNGSSREIPPQRGPLRGSSSLWHDVLYLLQWLRCRHHDRHSRRRAIHRILQYRCRSTGRRGCYTLGDDGFGTAVRGRNAGELAGEDMGIEDFNCVYVSGDVS